MKNISELQRVYDSEINFSISTLWDGGFDWRLGDEMNGFPMSGCAKTFAEAVSEICGAARKTYPDSAFAKPADSNEERCAYRGPDGNGEVCGKLKISHPCNHAIRENTHAYDAGN